MNNELDAIGEQIAEDVAHIDAALHGVLTKLRIFDAGGRWFDAGFRSCALWLSWRVGWGTGTAREHVRVANALGALPAIDNALGRGELSFSKVRAITRVATPANEQVLLEQARLTTGHQLEMICRKYASVKQHENRMHPDEDLARRYVSRRDTTDGMVRIEAVLHPDEAAVVWAALERVAAERCRRAPSASDAADSPRVGGDATPSAREAEPAARDDEPAARDGEPAARLDEAGRGAAPAARVDAEAAAGDELVARDHGRPTNESASRHVPAGTDRQPPTNASAFLLSAPPPPSPRARAHAAFDRADALVHIAHMIIRGDRPNRSPNEIMISMPIDTLMDRSHADPLDVACCTDGTALSSHAARRLACDASVVALIEDANGNALAAGRKRRTIPGSMKSALLRRDHKCRFPGCQTRVFLEGHHMEHWADGGKTNLSNILALCSLHHRFVHEHGFTIELRPDNAVVAYDNRGRAIPEVAPSPASSLSDLGWPNITRRNTALGISPNTIGCWDGTPVDYPELVDWILRTDARAAANADVLAEPLSA